MNPTWSKIVLYGYLAIGAALLVFEIVGLHDDNDGWPSITQLTVGAIRAWWWIALCVFGFLGWLIIHFARRI